MFDAVAFARMKQSARLINIGRGPIVVEEDLAQALQEKWIAGAALDVFSEEPLPHDHPLLAVPTPVISPHLSGDFGGWLDAVAALFVENFRRWLAGEVLLKRRRQESGLCPWILTVIKAPVSGDSGSRW